MSDRPTDEPRDDDPVASPDDTLAGYFEVHDRPPAFEGPDGHPYTVSMEVEKTGDLRAPFNAYLVFPRWAATGLGIVGHVETPTLAECSSSEEAMEHLGALTLLDVKHLLDEAVAQGEDAPANPT
jgi:hypothetical protein